MTRGKFPGAPREHSLRRRALLFLAGCSLFLLTLAVLSLFELSTGTPVIARAPQVVDINTPDFAMPAAARDADILPTTPEPLALARGGLLAPPGRSGLASLAQAPTATAAAGGRTLQVTPGAGPPGTQLTLTGHGWAPDESIVLRLQDAGPGQAILAEYPLAVTDSGGSFRANFTVPTDPPWGQLPALLLWAVSTKTGLQARAAQPFVIRTVATATPAVHALQGTATVTATLSATPAATGAATATLGPTPAPAASSPVGAEQAGAQPTFVVATLMPSSTPPPTFQSPLPTPEGSQPLPPPASPQAAQGSPAATAQATPRVLPSSGAPLLATVLVAVGPAALRSQPGQDYLVLMTLGRGTALGVQGQNATGDWLLVTTTQGVQGWLPAAATSWAKP